MLTCTPCLFFSVYRLATFPSAVFPNSRQVIFAFPGALLVCAAITNPREATTPTMDTVASGATKALAVTQTANAGLKNFITVFPLPSPACASAEEFLQHCVAGPEHFDLCAERPVRYITAEYEATTVFRGIPACMARMICSAEPSRPRNDAETEYAPP